MNSHIRIPEPKFSGELTSVILDLERLRVNHLIGGIPPYIFFQLKDIFQLLETLGSARIEGNNTTLADYIEKNIEQAVAQDNDIQEIKNIQLATDFIEANTTKATKIDQTYITELHRIVVENLVSENSEAIGQLRRCNVRIRNSTHRPPSHQELAKYFERFISFINQDYLEQYQLLMIAIAHHRFMYIHHFDDGNGRVGRLLNYALLVKLGFKVKHILNPSSVFYTDRSKYYEMLGEADCLEDKAVLAWAEYFLIGLKNEVNKIDNLLQADYTRNKILLPALKAAYKFEFISKREFEVLQFIVKKDDMLIKAEELNQVGMSTSKAKSAMIAKLKKAMMIKQIKPGGRIYTISFSNRNLLRDIINSLDEQGFVADFLNKN